MTECPFKRLKGTALDLSPGWPILIGRIWAAKMCIVNFHCISFFCITCIILYRGSTLHHSINQQNLFTFHFLLQRLFCLFILGSYLGLTISGLKATILFLNGIICVLNCVQLRWILYTSTLLTLIHHLRSWKATTVRMENWACKIFSWFKFNLAFFYFYPLPTLWHGNQAISQGKHQIRILMPSSVR